MIGWTVQRVSDDLVGALWQILWFPLWGLLRWEWKKWIMDRHRGPYHCGGCHREIWGTYTHFDAHIDECAGPEADDYREGLRAMYGRTNHRQFLQARAYAHAIRRRQGGRKLSEAQIAEVMASFGVGDYSGEGT